MGVEIEHHSDGIPDDAALESTPGPRHGCRMPVEIRTESWTSEALGVKLPVLSVTEDPLNGTRRSELKNARAIEFDAGYFSPDTQYEIVDVNGPLPRSRERLDPDRTR